LPTSSAISKAPVLSTATPTGRPCASPFVVLGLAVRMPAAEWHEYDLVAVKLLAVPAAVFADERAAVVFLRQVLGSMEDEPQERHVGAQRVFGDDSFFHQIRPLSFWIHFNAPERSCVASKLDPRSVCKQQGNQRRRSLGPFLLAFAASNMRAG